MKKDVKLEDPVPFHRPDIDADDRHAILRVLGSRWLTTGREARLFEDEFATYLGARHALAVSSCTAALHLALELAGVRGGNVIVPTLTFTATAAAVLMAGANPIIADIDENSLTLSLAAVEEICKTTTVEAIIPVHYGGNPSGFRELVNFGQHHKIPVIDDAAHALPAMVDIRRIGDPTLGAFATCFSFYPTKPITTGEGGMLVMGDSKLLEVAREMSLHGIDADAYQRSRGGLYHYEVSRMGWKYNLPDLLAALGRSQLKKSDLYWDRRARIAREYAIGLQPLVAKGWIRTPYIDDGCTSAWHLYVIRFRAERFQQDWTRDRIAEVLKERGISTSMHYRPLHLHPFWQPMVQRTPRGVRWTNADAAYQEILSLPIYPELTTEQVGQVVEAIEAVCRDAMR